MCLFLLVDTARAFSPADHRAISARALELEAGDAVPLPDALRRFPLAAAGEDWNLPRKWARWHHYYSPAFTVHSLWRQPSAERVESLDASLRAELAEIDPDRAWILAGFLAHHVQDMASPPHVVPVAHGLGDGFESYDFSGLIATSGRLPVPDVAPIEAQRALAASTARALAEPLGCGDETLAWSRFWAPGDGGFGSLGDLRFGRVAGCEAASEAFAADRIEEAVAYTRAIVRFVRGGAAS